MQSISYRLIFQIGVISGEGLKELTYYTTDVYEESNDIITFIDQDNIRRCFIKHNVFSIIPVQEKTEHTRNTKTYRKFDYYQCKEDYSSSLVEEPEEYYGDEYIPSDFEN